ncbi:amidohydrolase family protein [Psychrobium sp. nBUS_13]|uniref:amidohydrolase family protein n=1 Tax=Psychrobium sp. nBUS_13 TaxID=3395319 RepID=UPI003EBC9A21
MIDAHHHLWDLSKIHYPWLEAKGSERFFGQPDPIRKNYSPSDYAADHNGVIKRSVHIQVGCVAEDNVKETALIEDYIANGVPIAAIVSAVDVTAQNLAQQLTSQQAFNHVKGVRHMIGKSPEENHQLQPFVAEQWIPGWQLISERELTFDLQLTSEQYKDVYTALCQVPQLKFVLCHFASPWEQDYAGFVNWRYWMEKFANLPNCHFKLSGFSMFTHSFDSAMFIKYSKVAIEIFGYQRCMLGSNFPVDKLHMDYQTLVSAWYSLLENYSNEQQQWLSGKAAESFYSC